MANHIIRISSSFVILLGFMIITFVISSQQVALSQNLAPQFQVSAISYRQEAPTQSCNLSGLISANTTWSPDSCNPYIATGSVIVDTAYTLTIEAGVTIKWNPGTALTVRGALLAKGSAEQPVTFTSNQTNPASGDWAGIEFVDSSKDAEYDANESYLRGSIIQYSIIEYAGKKTNQAQGSPAINAVNASPYIDNTIIQNNQGMGVYIENGKTIHFTNNQVLFNFGTGIYFQYCEGDDSGLVDTLIHQNTINNNKDGGMYILSYRHCNPIISENTITNNSSDNVIGEGGGLYSSSTGINQLTTTLRKNIISNNSTKGFCGGVALERTDHHILEGNEINGNRSERQGGGVCVADGFTSVSMFDNDIKNNVSKSGGGGLVTLPGIIDKLVFHYNRFENNLNNGSLNHVYNNAAQRALNIDAENNWWGSSDPSVIESAIFHFADDSTKGVVDFEPFCNEACTPPDPLKVFLPLIKR